MNTFGALSFSRATEHPELVANQVSEALSMLANADAVGVAQIDSEFSDTAGFCAEYGIGMDQSANCVVLEAKRADRSWFAACVILGSMRADINGVARRALEAKKVSFAKMEDAVAVTCMEFGAITPLGLPGDWSILIDKAVVDAERVIIGSGVRTSKLLVPGSLLATLPNVQVIEGLANTRE